MNLRNQIKYKVFTEDGGPNSNDAEAWRYYELRGSRGKIYPYSETVFAAQVKAGKIGEPVRRLGKHKVIQDAEDFVVFLFDRPDLDFFAKIIKAKKRVKYSPEVLKSKREAMLRVRRSPTGSKIRSKKSI